MANPYGTAHQKRRAYLLTQLPYPCHLCGEPMWPEDARRLDLDHTVAVINGGLAGEGELTHRRCNRASGGRLAAARAKATRDAMTTLDPTKRRTIASKTKAPKNRTKRDGVGSFLDDRQD